MVIICNYLIYLEHDTFALLPTGAGKSIIYQLSGLVLPGCTFVISPLIGMRIITIMFITALMQNQVDALLKKKLPAVLVTSRTAAAERDRVCRCDGGDVDAVR